MDVYFIPSDPVVIVLLVCHLWMVHCQMGGAGRSGDGLQMVSRVSVGGAGLCIGLFKITAASSDNSGGQVLGLLCVEQYMEQFKSCYIRIHFDFFPCRIFYVLAFHIFIGSYLHRNICTLILSLIIIIIEGLRTRVA